MDQSEDPRELERKIEQAARIASSVSDQTTVQRLRAFVQDLRQKLKEVLEARRINQEIRARARELWEQNGRPSDRDLEFWLQAEADQRVQAKMSEFESKEGLLSSNPAAGIGE